MKPTHIKWLAATDNRLPHHPMRHKYRAPIEQYREPQPRKWWQKLLGLPVRYKLRIRREVPRKFNCRCAIINLPE